VVHGWDELPSGRQRCGGGIPPGGPAWFTRHRGGDRRPSGRAPPESRVHCASAGPPPFSGPACV